MKLSRTLPLMTAAGLLAMTASAISAQAPQATPTTATPAPANAAPNPPVGGAVLDAAKPIATNVAAAPNLTTLLTAAKAADLISTLSGPGPYTVFAPTNEAFGRLAPGNLDNLMKPANKAALAKVLTYHVVPGTITLYDLSERIKAGGGTVRLTTVEGEPITVTNPGGAFLLTDVNGNKSYIETPDVRQSNGIVHVVNGVLIPKLG
ncbi:MAG: fasciclin domain-containing protein [Sphingomonas sp.]